MILDPKSKKQKQTISFHLKVSFSKLFNAPSNLQTPSWDAGSSRHISCRLFQGSSPYALLTEQPGLQDSRLGTLAPWHPLFFPGVLQPP